jgi:hypothetical protein
VANWAKDDAAVSEALARAREAGWDWLAHDALRIADETANDVVEIDGKQSVNGEVIQRSKLRVDTRLKLLAVWDPKRYGARTALDVTVENRISITGALEQAQQRVIDGGVLQAITHKGDDDGQD